MSDFSVLIPEGKYKEAVLNVLKSLGVVFPHMPSRQLRWDAAIPGGAQLELIIAKMRDIPILLTERDYDLGFIGNEWVLETNTEGLLSQIADIGIYNAEIATVALKEGKGCKPKESDIKVFTKYSNIARRYLDSHKMSGKVIPLYGCIEGLLESPSDLGLVCTETGKTLKINLLDKRETLFKCSIRVFIPIAKTKRSKHRVLIDLVGALNHG